MAELIIVELDAIGWYLRHPPAPGQSRPEPLPTPGERVQGLHVGLEPASQLRVLALGQVLFNNGRLLQGAQPLAVFRAAIDREPARP